MIRNKRYLYCTECGYETVEAHTFPHVWVRPNESKPRPGYRLVCNMCYEKLNEKPNIKR